MNTTQLNLRRVRLGYTHDVARRRVYRVMNSLVNPITLAIRAQGRAETRGSRWPLPW